MARTSGTITAADDTDDIGPGETPGGTGGATNLADGGSAHDIPEGLVGNRSSDVRVDRALPSLDDFEIVDMDQPGDNRQQEFGGAQGEARLTERDQGDGTYLDQQAGAGKPRYKNNKERRQAQQRERDRSIEQVRALEAERDELRETVNKLSETVGRIEPRLSAIDTQRLEGRISDINRAMGDAQQRFEKAEDDLSAAVINADPDALKKALRQRDEALMLGNQLLAQKNMLETGDPTGQGIVDARRQQHQEPDRQQAVEIPAPMRAAVQRNVEAWKDDNPWIDTRSRDPQIRKDSEIMLFLDNQVAREGFNPATDDYWDELADRAAQYLPHRFQEGRPAAEAEPRPARGAQPAPRQQEPARRGPMTSGAGDRAPPRQGGKQTVQLTTDRKRALIEIGALDNDGRTIVNREKYARVIKSYADFDTQHGGVRQ